MSESTYREFVRIMRVSPSQALIRQNPEIFFEVLVVLTVKYLSETSGNRIVVTSQLADLQRLYDVDYYDPRLVEEFEFDGKIFPSVSGVFTGSVQNAYEFNETQGLYQDLNCGGIYSDQGQPNSGSILCVRTFQWKDGKAWPSYYRLQNDGTTGPEAYIAKGEVVIEMLRNAYSAMNNAEISPQNISAANELLEEDGNSSS